MYLPWAREAFFALMLGVLMVFSAGLTAAATPDTAVAGGAPAVMALWFDELLDVNVDKVYVASRYEQAVARAPNTFELYYSYPGSAKANLIALLYPEKLFPGIDFQCYSDVKTVMGGESDGVFLTNVTLFSRPLKKNLKLAASVYNLFDERNGFSASTEHLPQTIPLPGRSFRAKLTWRF